MSSKHCSGPSKYGAEAESVFPIYNWFLNRQPLHLASMYGCKSILKILVQNSTNIRQKGIFDKTPLPLAAQYGQTDAIKIL